MSDPLGDRYATSLPQLDMLKDARGRALGKGRPLSALVGPAVELPRQPRHASPKRRLPRGMGRNPRDSDDRLIKSRVTDSALLFQQVPDDTPDMRVGVRMSAAKGLATASVPLQVGTVRDNVEGGNPVPQGE